MPSETVENYLKAILLLDRKSARRSVSTGELASFLSVSPGTVTSMLKTLSDANLVNYKSYEGVQLSPSGRTVAARVVRRHRLIELFLVRTLELNWDKVHEEAELMEHAVSDHLIDRIDEFLGHPKFDPHGDPIPGDDGTFATRQEQTLAHCKPGTCFRVVRVTNQDAAFLRYISETGLPLDAKGTVVENRPEAGIMGLSLAEENITIARESADDILVAVDHPPTG
jgi:DtxR family Mn-dependent transcriptional regulator